MPWVRAGSEGSAWYDALLEAVAERYGFSLARPRPRPARPRRSRLVLYGSNGEHVTVRYQLEERPHPLLRRRLRGRHPQPEAPLRRRPPPTTSGRSSSATWPTAPARSAAAPASSRRVLAVTDRRQVDRRRHPAWRSARPRPGSPPWRRDPADDADAPLTEREHLIARQILKEIRERLGFLVDVGLDYLTLDRSANTLSGGEAQRIRLATQIGSSLMGVLYILDEPSIGLHQRDNARLIQHPGAPARHRQHPDRRRARRGDDARRRLDRRHRPRRRRARRPHRRRRHASTTSPAPRTRSPASSSAAAARSRSPTRRRAGNGKALRPARRHARTTCSDVTVRFPLGTFICVTGVSGSGKSSLVTDTLYPRLAQRAAPRRARSRARTTTSKASSTSTR